MVFNDRLEAAGKLAEALAAYLERNPLVLAIPRGAVPVAAPESLVRVKAYVDEVIFLHLPWDFQVVGQVCRDFGQVSDAEVVGCLRRFRREPPAPQEFPPR